MTVLTAPASGRSKAPDVIPGEPWRLLRELTAGPFRFGIYEAGGERSLRFAVGKGSVAGKGGWTTIDDGLVGEPGLGGSPTALMVTTMPIDGQANHLFVVHVGTSPQSAGISTTESHFVVRRESGKGRLVCRLPDEPVEISILETTPALIFAVTAGGERVRFVARANELCELEASDPQGLDSAKKLLFEATVAQGEMFRTARVWKKAGDAFQRALHLRPTGRSAEWLARSAIDMRSSYHDLQCWQMNGDELRELPIDGLLKLRLESYDDYLSFFPKSEHAAQVRYWKADLLDGCNHLDAAGHLYKEVSEGSREDELTQYARQKYDAVVERIQRRDQKGPNPTKGPAAQPGVGPAGPSARGLAP